MAEICTAPADGTFTPLPSESIHHTPLYSSTYSRKRLAS
jgi:hypothetical protein